MIRCAVFDFDGTLVDSNEIKRRTFFEVVRPFDPSGACVERALAAPDPGDRFDVLRAVADALSEAGRLPAERDAAGWSAEWAEAYGRICEDAIAAAEEIPGAAAALAALRERGVALFVSSATPHAALERVVARRGLEGWFAGVHGRPPDKARHLAEIARRTGARPGDVWMVGDGEDDRRAALAFGCPFVGVARSGDGRFATSPAHRITDLHALLPLLERLGALPASADGGGARVAARGR